MYDVVKARVENGASLTESTHCLRDVCSPALFSLFMNYLALDIIKGCKISNLVFYAHSTS